MSGFRFLGDSSSHSLQSVGTRRTQGVFHEPRGMGTALDLSSAFHPFENWALVPHALNPKSSMRSSAGAHCGSEGRHGSLGEGRSDATEGGRGVSQSLLVLSESRGGRQEYASGGVGAVAEEGRYRRALRRGETSMTQSRPWLETSMTQSRPWSSRSSCSTSTRRQVTVDESTTMNCHWCCKPMAARRQCH
jgi:hypothetical protein